MAILDYDTTPAHGADVTITLNLTELCSSPQISDSYFQNTSNISKAILLFQSTVGSEKLIFQFNCSISISPQLLFSFPNFCRDEFTIQKVILLDFDGDKASFTPSSLTISLSG